MMKFTGDNTTKRHVIRFEEWPIDCLVRYLEKNIRFLMDKMAPKIMAEISTLNLHKTNRMSWIRELDDLFTSCVNRLVVQMAREDKNILPYLNHLIVATEKKLPVNINSFSVVSDTIDSIQEDHLILKKIFDLIHKAVYDNRSDCGTVFYPQLFSAIEKFENELFHILDLQKQVLFPKICLLTSRS